jgi:5-methylcytosine-specific restriction endonuclease McrA
MSNKKKTRAEFRNSTFKRDKYCCIVCGAKGIDRQGGDECKGFHSNEADLVELDAHHITPREDMPGGGYCKENGATLCGICHQKAEEWCKHQIGPLGFSPSDLYQKIDSNHEKAVQASLVLLWREL